MAERQPDHEVYIVRDDAQKKWKTSPGRLGDDPRPERKVKIDQWIRWHAPALGQGSNGKEVILFFPDETIFGTSHVKLPFGEKITLEVKRKGKDDLITNKLEENLYAAYCFEPRGFAEGNSSPIIIIEK